MRPDEHKRKKNAQYKKKHGIAGDKASKQSDKTSHTHTQSSDFAPKQESDSEARGKKVDGQYSAARNDPLSSREEKEDLFRSERPKPFRRREVASNWDRYEGLDVQEDEDESSGGTLRGADYSQVLSAVSSSSSQFRFQDEKDWQEESGASPAEVTDLLAVDPIQLSAALDCVPLHQRLGIEETAFQPNYIELFMKDAREHREKYMFGGAADNQTPKPGEESVWEHDHSSHTPGSANSDVTKVTNDSTASTTVPVPTKDNSGHDLLDEILGASEIPGSAPEHDGTEPQNIPSSGESTQVKDAAVSNSDLADMSQQSLEGQTAKEQTKLDSTQQTPVTQNSDSRVEMNKESDQIKSTSCKPKATSSNIEDELDFLLDIDEGDNVGTTESGGEKTKGAADTGELESWLDDMLED